MSLARFPSSLLYSSTTLDIMTLPHNSFDGMWAHRKQLNAGAEQRKAFAALGLELAMLKPPLHLSSQTNGHQMSRGHVFTRAKPLGMAHLCDFLAFLFCFAAQRGDLQHMKRPSINMEHRESLPSATPESCLVFVRLATRDVLCGLLVVCGRQVTWHHVARLGGPKAIWMVHFPKLNLHATVREQRALHAATRSARIEHTAQRMQQIGGLSIAEYANANAGAWRLGPEMGVMQNTVRVSGVVKFTSRYRKRGQRGIKADKTIT